MPSSAVSKLGVALDAWSFGKDRRFVPIADPGQLGDGAGATLPRSREAQGELAPWEVAVTMCVR